MPVTTLTYNENQHEHKCVADALGSLQRMVDKGTIGGMEHSHYSGYELQQLNVSRPLGTNYKKHDVPGSGSGGRYSRTKNRVVVAVNKTTGKLVEDLAYFWRHDNRIYQLNKGFFDRAKFFRNM